MEQPAGRAVEDARLVASGVDNNRAIAGVVDRQLEAIDGSKPRPDADCPQEPSARRIKHMYPAGLDGEDAAGPEIGDHRRGASATQARHPYQASIPCVIGPDRPRDDIGEEDAVAAPVHRGHARPHKAMRCADSDLTEASSPEETPIPPVERADNARIGVGEEDVARVLVDHEIVQVGGPAIKGDTPHWPSTQRVEDTQLPLPPRERGANDHEDAIGVRIQGHRSRAMACRDRDGVEDPSAARVEHHDGAARTGIAAVVLSDDEEMRLSRGDDGPGHKDAIGALIHCDGAQERRGCCVKYLDTAIGTADKRAPRLSVNSQDP